MAATKKFVAKLKEASRASNSLLCVGLDPDPSRMPIKDTFEFNKAVIEATHDLVCAYKPNLAFYEALGLEGIRALERTLEVIPHRIPVVGDAKRGDIGNTARAYATSLFDHFRFDAVTVNPYLGYDSIKPFLEYQDRGIFILCRTSNPGARDFQDLMISGETPLYLEIARKAKEWNTAQNIGLVVGATYARELEQVRALCPEMPILVPGVGTQGGDLQAAVRAAVDNCGEMALIASSRQVLYASQDIDFAQATRREVLRLRDAINANRVHLKSRAGR